MLLCGLRMLHWNTNLVTENRNKFLTCCASIDGDSTYNVHNVSTRSCGVMTSAVRVCSRHVQTNIQYSEERDTAVQACPTCEDKSQRLVDAEILVVHLRSQICLMELHRQLHELTYSQLQWTRFFVPVNQEESITHLIRSQIQCIEDEIKRVMEHQEACVKALLGGLHLESLPALAIEIPSYASYLSVKPHKGTKTLNNSSHKSFQTTVPSSTSNQYSWAKWPPLELTKDKDLGKYSIHFEETNKTDYNVKQTSSTCPNLKLGKRTHSLEESSESSVENESMFGNKQPSSSAQQSTSSHSNASGCSEKVEKPSSTLNTSSKRNVAPKTKRMRDGEMANVEKLSDTYIDLGSVLGAQWYQTLEEQCKSDNSLSLPENGTVDQHSEDEEEELVSSLQSTASAEHVKSKKEHYDSPVEKNLTGLSPASTVLDSVLKDEKEELVSNLQSTASAEHVKSKKEHYDSPVEENLTTGLSPASTVLDSVLKDEEEELVSNLQLTASADHVKSKKKHYDSPVEENLTTGLSPASTVLDSVLKDEKEELVSDLQSIVSAEHLESKKKDDDSPVEKNSDLSKASTLSGSVNHMDDIDEHGTKQADVRVISFSESVGNPEDAGRLEAVDDLSGKMESAEEQHDPQNVVNVDDDRSSSGVPVSKTTEHLKVKNTDEIYYENMLIQKPSDWYLHTRPINSEESAYRSGLATGDDSGCLRLIEDETDNSQADVDIPPGLTITDNYVCATEDDNFPDIDLDQLVRQAKNLLHIYTADEKGANSSNDVNASGKITTNKVCSRDDTFSGRDTKFSSGLTKDELTQLPNASQTHPEITPAVAIHSTTEPVPASIANDTSVSDNYSGQLHETAPASACSGQLSEAKPAVPSSSIPPSSGLHPVLSTVFTSSSVGNDPLTSVEMPCPSVGITEHSQGTAFCPSAGIPKSDHHMSAELSNSQAVVHDDPSVAVPVNSQTNVFDPQFADKSSDSQTNIFGTSAETSSSSSYSEISASNPISAGMPESSQAPVVDPVLFQAVLVQLTQAYPQMAANPQLLQAICLQQTMVLQSYIQNNQTAVDRGSTPVTELPISASDGMLQGTAASKTSDKTVDASQEIDNKGDDIPSSTGGGKTEATTVSEMNLKNGPANLQYDTYNTDQSDGNSVAKSKSSAVSGNSVMGKYKSETMKKSVTDSHFTKPNKVIKEATADEDLVLTYDPSVVSSECCTQNLSAEEIFPSSEERKNTHTSRSPTQVFDSCFKSVSPLRKPDSATENLGSSLSVETISSDLAPKWFDSIQPLRRPGSAMEQPKQSQAMKDELPESLKPYVLPKRKRSGQEASQPSSKPSFSAVLNAGDTAVHKGAAASTASSSSRKFTKLVKTGPKENTSVSSTSKIGWNGQTVVWDSGSAKTTMTTTGEENWNEECDQYPSEFKCVFNPKRPVDLSKSSCPKPLKPLPVFSKKKPMTKVNSSSECVDFSSDSGMVSSDSDPFTARESCIKTNKNFLSRLLEANNKSNGNQQKRQKVQCKEVTTKSELKGCTEMIVDIESEVDVKEENWQKVGKKKKRDNKEPPKVIQPIQLARQEAKKSNYEKLVLLLQSKFPQLSRTDAIDVILKIRNERGVLSGLTVNTIVEMTTRIISTKEFVRPARTPTINTMLKQYSKVVVKSADEEGDVCPICCDELVTSEVNKLDCGHEFHLTCIRKWLLGHERTCPTCRRIALLPEEFPRLSK
ncbi:putative GPI-anchored protein pfl2 isoform X2 [Gigantopelta aegis]|uniref:putative GPI-anchored protein pfl2 isoform X2 n=1 Tax=Gigantopelta aegis TaxID=1735272 RepID=UPI001B888F5B|nr:putative GPI-anchored protein pfl2 isoform X2 [Gigantopelta aegis]